VAGFVLNPGAALLGACFGLKEVIKGVLPQLGVAVLGVAVLGPGPVGLLILLAAAGVVQARFGLGKINEALANRVAHQVVAESTRPPTSRPANRGRSRRRAGADQGGAGQPAAG
jgi:threonine dehydrogenase-like Zn-dependent dehydrogenase